ncbi:MAG: 3-oxoacyl-ACP synthase III [Deltaproteobacteria bacterium]|nr:MAG: 3-oxoacyl-ACP synthase III [Deltaproteobacteria bacterium]
MFSYSRVYIDSIGYELAPNILTSDDVEARLLPVYETLHIQKGQLEALTGIRERRYWDPGFGMAEGAARAAQKMLARTGLPPGDIGMVIYGGVCRDNMEPATACAVADAVGVSPDAEILDISNACLGVINGIVKAADAIELGRIRAALVVSCESSGQIIDDSIDRMRANPTMDVFKTVVATLTGGSGAAAVLVTDGSFSEQQKRRHRILGGAVKQDVSHHRLCIWGRDAGYTENGHFFMNTDSVSVLKNGVALGTETFTAFRKGLDLPADKPDKIICHQVGASHQKTILASLGLPPEKDFSTYPYLGNMGTVSLPMTAAIAHERGYLNAGDMVGFFGIGSGLNCMMLGIDW